MMKHHIVSDFESFDSLDFTPTLAMCFYRQAEQSKMMKYYLKLKNTFQDIIVIGSSAHSTIQKNLSSNSQCVDLNTFNLYFDHDCVWMLIALDMSAVNVITIENASTSELDQKIDSKRSYSALMLSSHTSHTTQKLITNLKKLQGIKDIFGAVSSSKEVKDSDKAELFHNGSFLKQSATLLLFDTDVYSLNGQSVHDFEPVGLELTITNSKGNTIYEIENRPALEMLESVIGPISQEDIDAFAYPLAIYNAHNGLECESKGGVISSISNKNREDLSVTMFKPVHTGDKLRISIPVTLEEQRKRIVAMLNNLDTNNSGLFFWFICIGVEKYYGEMERVFLLKMSKILKKEFIGFYSNGEIGRLGNQCSISLQNQTVTFVSLSKRECL